MFRLTAGVQRSRSCLSVLVLVAGLTIWLPRTAGHAATAPAPESKVKLGIRPVGVTGNFFDLTMTPGESLRLAVELRNFGKAPIAARTFPADAYTIVNGGFGARLRTEPKSGTTLWTDYKEEVLQLAAGQSVTREFSVTVPAQTAPGDYITGLVVENEKPVEGQRGSVAINQVQRQAIAVAITVPGPRSPGLKFERASHSFVGDRSVVAISLRNTGNVRLRPAGRLRITDRSGKSIFEGPVAMDSFYAMTATTLEAPLTKLLKPGRYVATLDLRDAEHSYSGKSPPLPFTVSGAPVKTVPATRPAAKTGLPLWLILLGIILLAVALLGGMMLGRRQRKDA